MGALLDAALKNLDSTDPKLVYEALLTIGEVVLVNRQSNFHSDVVPAANEEILACGLLEAAQKRVIRLIEEDPDGPFVQSAIGVLGSFHDRDLKPLLTTWLRRYYDQAAHPAKVVGQITVTLNNLGESVISGSSYSNSEFGKNLDDAARYLRDPRRKT